MYPVVYYHKYFFSFFHSWSRSLFRLLKKVICEAFLSSYTHRLIFGTLTVGCNFCAENLGLQEKIWNN